jgi:eukaryotic-like serine/threonine-protein kinase
MSLITTRRRVLHGRYEVGELIGSGATADVHRGRDLSTGRLVAIKVLRTSLAQDQPFLAGFRREVRAATGLRHPAIVAVYDTGFEDIDTGSAVGMVRVPFIVMEHIAGQSLRALLRIRRLTLAESLQYQLGVLSALEASHRVGLVHRDVKPANVMVTPEGAVKLVDFGIARALDDPDQTSTLAGVLLGTPTYLSPEQARGEIADARSDLYSAGCLLFELLTGRPPFVGMDPVSVVYQHVHEEPTRANTSIPALDDVLMKSLAKAPQDRFQDARSFGEALLAAAIASCTGTATAVR